MKKNTQNNEIKYDKAGMSLHRPPFFITSHLAMNSYLDGPSRVFFLLLSLHLLATNFIFCVLAKRCEFESQNYRCVKIYS